MMVDNKSTNIKKITSGVFWRFAERIGAQGVTLLVSIILARILEPSQFGVVAIITVFISLFQIFVDSGFSTSLVQKKGADNIDFSTVFWFNLGFCSLLYAFLFFIAPLISEYYQVPDLCLMIRVYGVVLIISGIKNVQFAFVSKNLDFKKFFWSTLGGTIIAAIVGIFLALSGAGAWALVIQAVVNITVDTTILWLTVKWRPDKTFSFQRLRELYKFGWKIFATVLISTLYDDMRQLIIGKKYSTNDLAFYNKGSQYPKALNSSIGTALDSNLLPAMSNVQDNDEKLLSLTRKSLKLGLYFIAPIMIIFITISNTAVKLLLTEKWLPCVPYIVIFCIVSILTPLHSAHFNAMNAKGRSDIPLKLGILKTILQVITLLISMHFGVFYIALGYLAAFFVGVIIDCIPNITLINYSVKHQFLDVFPILFINIAMFAISYPLSVLPFNEIFVMILQIFVSVIFYFVISKTLKIDSLSYLKDILRRKK